MTEPTLPEQIAALKVASCQWMTDHEQRCHSRHAGHAPAPARLRASARHARAGLRQSTASARARVHAEVLNMKLADILKASAARVKSNEEAEDYVGGRANLAELVRGYGIKPIRQNGKVTQWDTNELDAAGGSLGAPGSHGQFYWPEVDGEGSRSPQGRESIKQCDRESRITYESIRALAWAWCSEQGTIVTSRT